MNTKDKQIVKDVALVAADEVVSRVPGLGLAWGLSKALHGAGMKLRQQKALEWVEMVRDHPEVFIEDLLKQEDFQDGFNYALEKYLAERNQDKRDIIKKVFLGFASSEERAQFELERLLNTTSIISLDAVNLLSYIDENILPEMEREYREHKGNIIQRLSQKVEEQLGDEKGERHDTNQLRDTVAELISLGIFRSWTESYNTIGGGGSSLEYNLSIYGNNFLLYIK
tara:strand:- start:1 stop:678 length:678 start_codon:yes stop_codon:yes gene_type:complete